MVRYSVGNAEETIQLVIHPCNCVRRSLGEDGTLQGTLYGLMDTGTLLYKAGRLGVNNPNEFARKASLVIGHVWGDFSELPLDQQVRKITTCPAKL